MAASMAKNLFIEKPPRAKPFYSSLMVFLSFARSLHRVHRLYTGSCEDALSDFAIPSLLSPEGMYEGEIRHCQSFGVLLPLGRGRMSLTAMI